MNSRYGRWRERASWPGPRSRPVLCRYLGGATAARTGDEMSGPALLLLGLAMTGRPATGSALLASVTFAGAAGGPALGALLDRSRLPNRVLAAALAVYAAGIVAVQAVAGQLPTPAVLAIALTAGLFSPAVAGGWTAQLPGVVAGSVLARSSALDAMTYSAASLAGPALAAVVAVGLGARAAVLAAAALVALAVPPAWALSPRPSPAGRMPVPGRPAAVRQITAGFAAIVTRRPLLRATVTSAVSYAGIGMLLVCSPVLGAQRLGGAARGALLIAAIAAASLIANAMLARRAARGQPDVRVFGSTLVIGASMAAAAAAPGWLVLAAVALCGTGEGPQLTALFAVRHREAPGHMRGQIYTTAASMKIAAMAAGAALAGPLAGRSVTGCLLIAAGTELCAAAAYLLTGRVGTHRPRRGPTGRVGTHRPQHPAGSRAGPPARSSARSGLGPRGTSERKVTPEAPPDTERAVPGSRPPLSCAGPGRYDAAGMVITKSDCPSVSLARGAAADAEYEHGEAACSTQDHVYRSQRSDFLSG